MYNLYKIKTTDIRLFDRFDNCNLTQPITYVQFDGNDNTVSRS